MTRHTDGKQTSNGRILLAEDEQIGQIVTSRVLENAAYDVDVVENGLEAIDALETTDYDLVVMDCSMPVMDGFAATRAVRSADSRALNPDIPIIALTALDTQADREKCVEAGMNDYVSKPVDSSVLVAAIRRCLRNDRDDEASPLQQPVQGQPVWEDGFLDTIIDKFLEEVPTVVTELERALERSDTAALKNIGHRLRGPADLIKAATLSARSEALEKAATGIDFKLTVKLTVALISELRALSCSLSDE